MFANPQQLRVTLLFAVFAAMGLTGITLLAYGPHLELLVMDGIQRSTPEEKLVSQAKAIAALRQLGADVYTDASGKSANGVVVFQEALFTTSSGYHRFSDADMKFVAALRELEQLHVIETDITDGSLSCLKNQPRIRRLTLRNYNLTDAAVNQICQLRDLEYLNVCQTQISASGLEDLRNRFPNCEIEYDQRVRVGQAVPDDMGFGAANGMHGRRRP